MRILLIEDDAEAADAIGRCLQSVGYHVLVADNGRRGLEQAIDGAFGLILLDVTLPGLGGYEVCRQLRHSGVGAPVIMITARDAVHDRVQGLESGADDYLIKPFDFDELIARVRAQLRRNDTHRTSNLRIGDLEIRSQSRQVFLKDKEISLTPKEYQILEALAMNEGRVLSRDILQTRVWGHDESGPNVVDMHIMALRRKLERHGCEKVIHTVRGFGYCLRSESRV